MLLWTWLSVMNPHRLTWGFAFDFPFAALAASAALVSLLVSRDKKIELPRNEAAVEDAAALLSGRQGHALGRLRKPEREAQLLAR